MGLVDDHGELAAPVLVADGVEDERELLDRGDDDPLSLLEQLAEMAGVLGMAHDGADLGELPDGVPDLLVQQPPVGDDEGGVKDDLIVPFQPCELVGQPGNGVGLAAASRVLDQVPAADSFAGHVIKQPSHHVELVVAGPYLLPLPVAGLVVPRLQKLGVVLDDVGEPAAGEDLLPQVVGLEAVRVRRIAGAVVPPPVEGQEPRRLGLKLRAEPHLVVVDGEMRQAAAELKELLPRIAVPLVLLDGVFHRLLGQAVLQLEGGDGQAVDEQAQV